MATPETTRDTLYIDGAWVPSSGTGSIDVIDSTTEEVMGTVPEGTPEDVDRAVAAARAAFPAWSARPVAERTALLTNVSEQLAARMDELADLITHEVGMPLVLSQLVQVGLPLNSFATAAQVADDFTWEQTVGNSLVVREPIGVVGCITPWNYPLHQIAAKVAPALAAGCTVVVKPSEVAPLNAFVLADIMDEVGVPAGVFNLVTGFGPVVGEAIAAHRDVDMVSFTGSTRAGKRVTEVAAGTVKRVALELGGKSANVILPDADLATAVPDGVGKCFLNSGQTCSALTRMLVPRDKLAEVELLARATAEAFTPGDPFDGSSRIGPLRVGRPARPGADVHRQGRGRGGHVGHRRRRAPRRARARLLRLTDGVLQRHPGHDHRPGGDLRSGAGRSSPTTPRTRPSRSPTTPTTAWPEGCGRAMPEHAKAVARRLRTGQVEVNGGSFNPMAPFGGYKQSGNGREFGSFGLEEFLEVKSLQL